MNFSVKVIPGLILPGRIAYPQLETYFYLTESEKLIVEKAHLGYVFMLQKHGSFTFHRNIAFTHTSSSTAFMLNSVLYFHCVDLTKELDKGLAHGHNVCAIV